VCAHCVETKTEIGVTTAEAQHRSDHQQPCRTDQGVLRPLGACGTLILGLGP
jgi:hypothetical protein